MFLHLGGDTTLPQKEIIGIFAYNHHSISPVNKEFLSSLSADKKIVELSEIKEAKSYILTDNKVYFSPISSVTLLKRASLFLQE